jgi:hypothetical protein
MYYHVWDDTPYPKYNENFYRSCDAIFSISKQTHNLVRQVWKKEPPKPWQTKYIPHGINTDLWKKLDDEPSLTVVEELKKKLFGDEWEKINFVVLYNNRNIRRKMTSDVILAYKSFIEKLTPEQRDGCRILFHCAPVDENGTDLPAVLRDVAPNVKAVFSTERVAPRDMVNIYHLADVVINLASNEGFGIGTLEAMMTERMIIANVTGGLQDQMGFKDEKGNYLDPEIHYNNEWGSNADGRYKEHGEWVIPIFPNNRSLIGSPVTPYIFDDRCDWNEAAVALRTIYDMPIEERERRGKLGREWAMSRDIGMTAENMSKNFIDGINTVFEKWKPRARFGIYKSE